MIRWITDRLGTAPGTSAEIGDDIARVDVRDLVDKFGNSPAAILAKIEEGSALLGSGRRVIVCCDYGISRSNAVAAGILAHSENIPLEQAIRIVVEATGEKEIKLEPLNAVRRALEGGTTDRSSQADLARVLITGGTGFIGQHLRAALTDRAEVVVAAGSELDLTAGAVSLNFTVEENRINQIVHLANPRVRTSNRGLGDALSMFRNVLDVCRSTGIRLVYLSSVEVYSGYRAQHLTVDETMPLRPKGPYGETKMLCEQLLTLHRELYGLDASVIRSSPIYGGGSDKPKFLHTFVRKAIAGVELRTHCYQNGEPMLDLMHVDDLVAAIAAVVVGRVAGDFNLGGGCLYSTRRIAELVIDACSSGSPIGQQALEDGVANILMDTRRANTLLGWRALRSFESSLPEIIAH